ncbi:MAG: LON peptidase substrate-binding domain-containing protein [Spirochaetota bacterium]
MTNKKIRLFYLRKKVLFPHCTITVTLRKSKFSSALKKGEKILVFSIRYFFDIFFLRKRISTLAEISEITETKSHIKLQLKGIARAQITKNKGLHLAEYHIIEPDPETNKNSKIAKELRIKAQELIFIINVNESDRLIGLINYLVDVSQISDFIGNYFVLDYQLRLELLNESNVKERSSRVLAKLQELIEKISEKKD